MVLYTHTFFSWPRGKHSWNTSSSGCGRPSSHTVRTACATCSAAYQNWRFPLSTHGPRGKTDREHVNKHFYSHIQTYKSSWIGYKQLRKWIPFSVSYTWTHHRGLYISENPSTHARTSNVIGDFPVVHRHVNCADEEFATTQRCSQT